MATTFAKPNIRLNAGYWSRVAATTLFAWSTNVTPVFPQSPAAPDAAQQPPLPSDQQVQAYSMTDLEYLLGPIALYPDLLLKLILQAASFPEQIDEAAKWIASNQQMVQRNDFAAVDAKPWDPSVQALQNAAESLHINAKVRRNR